MIFKKSHNIDSFIDFIIAKKPFLIQNAKDWAKDCTWEETQDDPNNEFIDQIPSKKLLTLINRHYDGGIQAFVADNL